MMASLRKRHRQAWTLSALVLPAAIVLAWLVIPNQSPVKLLQQHTAGLLPVTVRFHDKEDYHIVLRSNKEKTKWQLEWKNKTVLTVPSAVIYKAPAVMSEFQLQDAELIGRIESTGSYVFDLRPGSYGKLNIVLYDFIHERIIERIII